MLVDQRIFRLTRVTTPMNTSCPSTGTVDGIPPDSYMELNATKEIRKVTMPYKIAYKIHLQKIHLLNSSSIIDHSRYDLLLKPIL